MTSTMKYRRLSPSFRFRQASETLAGHPKLGDSWEGFIVEQLTSHLRAEPDECHFWATHTGAELDLLVVRGNTRRAFEIKRTSAPSVTPSMRSALTVQPIPGMLTTSRIRRRRVRSRACRPRRGGR